MASMPPPLTPRRASVDMSLKIPADVHDQSRSVEAMVMSVPYHVKIKVLGRITPPLKTPGPTSPVHNVRGAVIAIEGEDTAAVKELTRWLSKFLGKNKEYHTQVAEPPKVPDTEKKDVTFADYLELIKEWHGKSREMVDFITTPITSPTTNDVDDKEMKDDDKEMKDNNKADRLSPMKPVILLPTYQLRAADVYTSRIPIVDAYSPTDHWQWMATLWRGTVGPDLTVYIKDATPEELGREKLVDVSEEVRLLTARKPKGSWRLDDGALRRVGFEVDEWIRAVGMRKDGH